MAPWDKVLPEDQTRLWYKIAFVLFIAFRISRFLICIEGEGKPAAAKGTAMAF